MTLHELVERERRHVRRREVIAGAAARRAAPRR